VTDPSLTRRLVRRVRAMPVGDADRSRAERFVRDWLGSYVAGGAAPVGGILQRYGVGVGAGVAGGTSGPVGPGLEAQVFLAAARSHVTETDDLHRASVTHPGCVVIPVALLLGHDRGASGHEALRATLAGYEVMTRVGEALGAGHYRLFHNTATAGVFGSAAAAASLLDLDEDGWVWALGSAGTQAAGLWQFNEEGAMSKPLHAGHAAAAGLRAALLAAAGLTGAERILEGEKGLFRALCPDARPGAVLADAAGWKLPETSMKPYPCCRHVHPAVDAALEVRALAGLDREGGGDAVAAVRIWSYPAALDVTDRQDPGTPHEARFSLQYAVVRTLLHGRPGLDAFEPEALRDEAVRVMLARTTVAVDPGLAEAYPRAWGAHVEVVDQAGATYRAERASATGDPDHPLDDTALDAKVRGLFDWAGLPREQGRLLLEPCRGLVADGPLPEPW
jgi:2-methylcitrate dehydratase PrpD